VQELIPVLEEAADHHGLARAWRLLTYGHMTATQWGVAAEAAGQTIRQAELAGDEVMARRFAGALATSGLACVLCAMPVSRCPDFPRVRSGGFGGLILHLLYRLTAGLTFSVH
jgi:hypothetical protein